MTKLNKYLPTVAVIIVVALVAIAVFISMKPPAGTTGSGTAGDQTMQVSGNFVQNTKTF